MAKKKKKKPYKRIFLVTIFCFSVCAYIIYSVGTIFYNVYDLKNDNKRLNIQLNNLKDEEEILKSEVNKLKDPVYIAKYAREKFLYSGDGEYVIKMK